MRNIGLIEIHEALDNGLDPEILKMWVDMWMEENPDWMDVGEETDDDE